ncbi:MAG: hypothetical protein UY75_C0004G0018 [Parcubacteria group bacterium GW2011_GWC2_52_8c]|nr:MAG: hypothetical protein UY75_C0004G0018 [Parcubacteria group bacterium GW2011_GWC2_52_8c]
MKETIRLGFISGLSGVYGWSAQDQLRGITLAVEQINSGGGISGKKVSIISRDDTSDPKKAAEGTRYLIEKEKIDFMVGGLSAGTQLFINEEMKKAGLLFISIGQSNEITTAKHLGPYTFHEALTPYMTVQGMGKWVFANLGKKIFIVMSDYEWGWHVLSAYELLAKEAGAQIVGVAKIPFPAKASNDFSKHFPVILKAKPEVLIAANFGADQLKFIEDVNTAGLQRKMSIVNTLSELPVMERISPEKATGLYWGGHFYWGLKDMLPEANNFVSLYTKRFNGVPSGYAAYGYSGAMELLTAAKKVNRYPINPKAIAEELEGNAYAHCKDKQWWRPCDHQSMQDYYILKLKGAEDRAHPHDISEIIGVTPWDLDMERSCQKTGNGAYLWGHTK